MRTMKLLLATLLTIAAASCGGGGGGNSGGGATTYTLTVTKSGTGSGAVTSSAAGISCGGTCSAAFNSGASVTLTATADSGSAFVGWSGGGCSGTGTCTVAMSAATGVTATFNTGSGGSASTASYNFYTDKNGGLYAVDSASPTTPQTVDTGVASDSTRTIAYGSYDSTTKVLSGLHAHYVVYAKGGKIYRVNAVKGQSLTPTQVSSETGAATVCNINYDSEFMNPDNSIYIYQLPGPDGNCNTSDDVEKMVTVGMSASTSPITITPKKRITYGIYDANLSITGLLVTESGVLKKCNVNLSTCSDLKTGVSSVSEMGSYETSKTYLRIDNGLYVYDAGANTLSSSLYTYTGTSSNREVTDSSAFYFADGTKILKLPHNSSNVTTLITETTSINYLRLTDNSLYYTVSSYYKTLKAVPKTGGAATTLASVSGASDSIYSWGTTGNYVYYDKTVSGVPSAGRILDDGTGGSEVSNAKWVGFSISSTLSLSKGTNGFSIGRYIRVDGCTATGCGGGTLKSFDPSTDLSTNINIGQLPTEFSSFESYGFGSGSNLLGGGYNSTNTLSDIFYLNVDTANSLVRITNTTVREDIVY